MHQNSFTGHSNHMFSMGKWENDITEQYLAYKANFTKLDTTLYHPSPTSHHLDLPLTSRHAF